MHCETVVATGCHHCFCFIKTGFIMDVSIIAIGDELLIGQVVDTNSGMIAQMINPYGWRVRSVRVVADDGDEIRRAIDAAMSETDVVLTTGGLGPTKDDITKPTLCDYFGGTLVYDKSVEANVLEVVAKRGLKINALTAAQAWVPSSCRVIQNRVGTAPLMWFERDGKVLVSMPGVPFETEEMFRTEVFPQLRERFDVSFAVEHRTFVVVDHSESVLAGKLADFEQALPSDVHLAYLPKPGMIRLRLTGTGDDRDRVVALLDEQGRKLHDIVGESIVCDSDKMPAEILGDMLRSRRLTVSTAESCTGGNIAHEITAVAGSSDYYIGSVVSYANAVKTDVLGVDAEALARVGAVSEEVVRGMVDGACRLLGTDCAIATSGIAGPSGGSAEKPVGTVWIATRAGDNVEAKEYHFAGNRSRVINHATTIALIQLIKMLKNK